MSYIQWNCYCNITGVSYIIIINRVFIKQVYIIIIHCISVYEGVGISSTLNYLYIICLIKPAIGQTQLFSITSEKN